MVSVGVHAMEPMQSQATDNERLPLTGLTDHQLPSVLTLVGHKVVPAARGRPWGIPLPVRVLLVLICAPT
jgi:hypothetical protein